MNNRILPHILTTLLGILSLTACNRADEWEATGGDTGLLVTLTDATAGVETRATPQELREQLGEEFLDQFRLTITHLAGEQEVYDSIPYDTELIRVPAGFYDVEATFGNNPTLALDAPYYTGRAEDVEVKGHQQKSISIACSVANALLSVKYENVDKLNEKFTNYYVSVQVGEESVDIKDTKQSAYFRAGTSSLQLSFHYDEGQSQPITSDAIPATFEAGDHLILTLRMSPTMTMEIAKAEIKSVTVEETIPQEWLPKPKITGFNENEASFVSHTETAVEATPAKLNFTGNMTIDDVELTLDLQDKDFETLNGTYLLSTLTAEDRTKLTQAGITLPALKEANSESIDFTNLTGKLKIASGSTTTHTIKLRVKANGRWSSEEDSPAIYEIRTIAPKITLTAQPEDIWSKTLTVNGATIETGDEATIRSDLKYQYLENGTWKDCQDGMAALTTQPENAQLQVRAVYRGVVECEPTTFELETPQQLPNANMEEWYSETVARSIRSYYPWSQGTTGFWNTNNDYTTRYREETALGTGSEVYNCFPAVSYVSGRNGGKAAELRNTAAGRGNTKFIGHTELDINKVAGELFIGGIEVVNTGTAARPGNDHYNIDKGKEFNSRPTELQFYYKYVPYNNDTWKASIELLDENKETIITQEVRSSAAQNEYTPMSIKLNYEESKSYAKCKYIYIVFSSTINTGSSLPYGVVDYTLIENGGELPYSDAYIGSVLTIDDISLIYDK